MISGSSVCVPAWAEQVVATQLGRDVSIDMPGWFVNSAGLDLAYWSVTPTVVERLHSTANEGLMQPHNGVSSSRAVITAPAGAKTDLGRRLREIRQRIVASGEPLLDRAGLARELAERRGTYGQDA